ncbi:MAG TPA: PA14 domain-containing protein, partial [Polyangiaceae bacterium]
MARSLALAPLLLLGLGTSFGVLPACSAPDGSDEPADVPGDEAALGTPTSISFQNGVSPTTSYAGATDTSIEEATPTAADGSDGSIHADFDYPDGTNQNMEGLLRFDVSAIPAGSTITSASITLNVTNRTTGTGYSLYPLSRAWTASQATWNAAKSGSNWATPGARGTSDRSAAAIGTLTPTVTGKTTVTLNAAGLAAVQAWVADPSKNFGLVLDTANDPDGLIVDSSEAATASNRPKLSVAYTPPSAPAAGNGTGLEGDYYAGTAFQKLVTTRTDKTIDFTWSGSPASGVPADGFSVRWTGQVLPLYSQTYTFYAQSDDGVRVWVNGTKIIDNWTDHGSTENTGTIALTAGKKVDVKVEYYENTGNAVAELSWSSPSQTKQIVPTSQLFPPATTTPPTTTGFVHPGILNSKAQLDFVKAKIAAGAQPWTAQ